MLSPKLYMLLLGCKPKGRFTEQHDVFFGIGHSLRQLVPQVYEFWSEAKGNLHIDAWREISSVDGYKISVVSKQPHLGCPTEAPLNCHLECPTEERVSRGDHTPHPIENGAVLKLFFINLGGYKVQEFEEFHYKFITVAENPSEAIKNAKGASFYKHTGFKGAVSHIDEKYGVDVDDIMSVQDILKPFFKNKYALEILPGNGSEDELHLGYLQLWRIKEPG